MTRSLLAASALVGVFMTHAVQAEGQQVKVSRIAPSVASWTGFYLGGQIGGAWADRTVSYAANDPASSFLVTGTTFPGDQPFPTHGHRLTGVTGGIEIGYNWQLKSNWVLGIEADLSASDVHGSSSGTSELAGPFVQTLTSEQRLEWWGTVRGRLGWLPGPDLLLFGTAGLAYGEVATSNSYIYTGPAPSATFVSSGGFSFACFVNVTCFDGSTSRIRAGWTVGGGAEWRFSPAWSLKIEYLYLNFGRHTMTATARARDLPGTTLSSYTADVGRTDFHVARFGVNFHF